MARQFVSDVQDGDSFEDVLLVRGKQVRLNRNGERYLQLDLNDRSGSIGARYWNATDDDIRKFEPGDYLSVVGKVQLFQGQLQMIVHQFHRADLGRVDPTDFIPSTPKSMEHLVNDLRSSMDRITDPAQRAIWQAFAADGEFFDRFCRAPAGIRNHHAYLGGLLEHVVALLKLIDRIADLYPQLDIGLLKLGAFLHDAGKIREMSYDATFSYTTEGQLIGHIVMGVEMLEAKLGIAAELLGVAVPEVLVWKLKHLILSHHGSYAYGSPKLPMFPEAAALHHLDDFDAKVHNFTHTIANEGGADGEWTPYDPQLGRRLFTG